MYDRWIIWKLVEKEVRAIKKLPDFGVPRSQANKLPGVTWRPTGTKLVMYVSNAVVVN